MYRGRKPMNLRSVLTFGLVMLIILVPLVITKAMEIENEKAAEVWRETRTQASEAHLKQYIRPVLTPEPEITPKPTPEITPEPTHPILYQLTETDADLSAATNYYEAGTEGLEGMIAVSCVQRNRLEDPRFPDELKDVCIASQFHGLYSLGTEDVSADAYIATERVFEDGYIDITNGGLYFCTEDTDPDLIKKGLRETARIGNHVFYTDIMEGEGYE